MKVSVIVPAYNEEKYLGKCLEALKNQTLTPDEIIVVDNNSTDRTSEIAKEARVRVITEKSQGLTYARNSGFNHAIGDVLLRTDSDTQVPKDWVERMSKHFEDPEVGRVTGGAVFYKKWLWPVTNFLIFWVNEPFGYKALFGPNFALRREVWEKVRDEVHIHDERFHEDLDIAIHTGRYGKYVRDLSIEVKTSSRRANHPGSLIIHYHIKWRNTVFLKAHRKLSKNPLMRLF